MKKLVTLVLAVILAMSTCCVAFAEESQYEPKHYSMMVSVSADMGHLEDMWLFDYIEELFNITFDFIEVSSEGYNEKLNLAFATNDLPDLLFNMEATDIAYYAAQGLIQPLDEYMNEEYLPNLMYWIERYPDYIKALYYPDGHVYDIRGLIGLEREYSSARAWINKVWLDELGMDYPKTLDDFYAFLKAVKENDLNGDGELNEIPFSGMFDGLDGDNHYFDNTIPVLTAFGMTSKTVEAYDGVVKFNPTTEAYKEYLTFMNKLWTEGLIDPEYFTQTADQFKAKTGNMLAATLTDWAVFLRVQDDSWEDYTCYYPMTSSINDKQLWPAEDILVDRHFIVTSHCEDVAGLMPLLNWCLTPDGIYDSENGDNMAGATVNVLGKPKGVWDKYTDYGWYITTATDEETGEEYQVIAGDYPEDEYLSANAMRNAWYTPNIFPVCEVFEGNPLHYSHYGDEAGRRLAVDIIDFEGPYYHTGWSSNIRYTAEEADEIALLQNDIFTYAEQMIARFITGEASLDEFDTYVQGCEARGLARYIEINQAAYDRYNSVA